MTKAKKIKEDPAGEAKKLKLNKETVKDLEPSETDRVRTNGKYMS